MKFRRVTVSLAGMMGVFLLMVGCGDSTPTGGSKEPSEKAKQKETQGSSGPGAGGPKSK